MSRPPKKAIVSIKNYCEKTQCRRCVFGERYEVGYGYDYVGCKLMMSSPCDWETEEGEE